MKKPAKIENRLDIIMYKRNIKKIQIRSVVLLSTLFFSLCIFSNYSQAQLNDFFHIEV